jgi:hypothetical protein
MKVSNSIKLTGILLISLIGTLSINAYAKNVMNSAVESESQANSFPEQLKTLIELPGKKDFIEIPMQESFAAKNFVDYLSYENDYGNRLRTNFIEMSPAHNGIVKAKLKTTGRSLDVTIQDLNTNYYYKYSFGNGYVFSTMVSIPMPTEDDNGSLRIQYIHNKIDTYLINQGYTNTTLMLRKILTGCSTYEKGDILVETDSIGFNSVYYTITATNKQIQKDLSTIIEDTTQKDIASEYQALDKILETK